MTPLDELKNMKQNGLTPLSSAAFLMMMNNLIGIESMKAIAEIENLPAVTGMSMAAKEFTVEIQSLIDTWRKVRQPGEALTRADLDRAIKTALLDKNTNPFFSVYAGLLNPIIISGRIAWDTAELFDSTDEPDTYHSCMTRMYEIFPMIVYALWSGVEHMTPVEAQRFAMTKALECSIVMRASVAEFVRSA